MERKQIISIAIGVVVLGILVFLGISLKGSPSGPSANTLETGGAATSEPAPPNVRVPEQNSENVPSNVAKPSTVSPAGPNSSASLRRFNIKVELDKFIPDTVIVNAGDTIHLDLTAVDKSYDFTQPDYGLKQSMTKGQTKVVEFGATSAGKFAFFCSACGGPDKGPVGYVIIVAK